MTDQLDIYFRNDGIHEVRQQQITSRPIYTSTTFQSVQSLSLPNPTHGYHIIIIAIKIYPYADR